MTASIRTCELSKQYRRSLILDDLNLEVPEGSIFGLVGPNGAGKTTTIKILMNLIQPTSGRAEVVGRDSRHLRSADFERIGYVSENQEMPDWMTVDQFLAYLRPFYTRWDNAIAAEMVKRFELPRNRKLRHLSRGMWMKAALASTLAYRPELLVLDEPFSGLDPLMRDDFIQGILHQAGETTILISSHDLADIESFASHIAFLDGGRLRFSEEMESLSKRFREVQVSVADGAQGSTDWPEDWLLVETSGARVRFIDTRFNAERTLAEVHRRFGPVAQMAANPMPLRAIFVAMARNSQKAAAKAGTT